LAGREREGDVGPDVGAPEGLRQPLDPDLDARHRPSLVGCRTNGGAAEGLLTGRQVAPNGRPGVRPGWTFASPRNRAPTCGFPPTVGLMSNTTVTTLDDNVFERLLRERIIVLGQEVDDGVANR